MVRGFNQARSLEMENTRAICYQLYLLDRDMLAVAGAKNLGRAVSMEKFWPLLTDERREHTTTEEDLKREQAELIERINKQFGKNLKAQA